MTVSMGQDRTLAALKYAYRLANLLGADEELETEIVHDLDGAEEIAGTALYGAMWRIGMDDAEEGPLSAGPLAQLIAAMKRGEWS